MNEFDHQPIQAGDLRALMAVLRDGTVTRAAQSLGLTQSATLAQMQVRPAENPRVASDPGVRFLRERIFEVAHE
jgi:hypothetical protein